MTRVFRHFDMKVMTLELEEMDDFVASAKAVKMMVEFKENFD